MDHQLFSAITVLLTGTASKHWHKPAFRRWLAREWLYIVAAVVLTALLLRFVLDDWQLVSLLGYLNLLDLLNTFSSYTIFGLIVWLLLRSTLAAINALKNRNI